MILQFSKRSTHHRIIRIQGQQIIMIPYNHVFYNTKRMFHYCVHYLTLYETLII